MQNSEEERLVEARGGDVALSKDEQKGLPKNSSGGLFVNLAKD
jgi:hypothetical protein